MTEYFYVGAALLLTVGAIGLVVCAISEGSLGYFIAAVFAVVLLTVSVRSCQDTPAYKAKQAADAAEESAEAVPRLMSEKDGCKVYTFRAAGQWHFFTQCPNAHTSTDTTHEVRSGKTTHTEIETIESK